jgi:hypothetical protein
MKGLEVVMNRLDTLYEVAKEALVRDSKDFGAAEGRAKT